MRILRFAAVLGIAVGLGVGGGLAAGALPDESEPADDRIPPLGRLSASEVGAFTDFPLYGLGDAFEGMPLRLVSRVSPEILEAAGGPPPMRTVGTPKNSAQSRGHNIVPDNVTFVYSSCKLVGTCAEIQIQIWKSCNRFLDDYESTPGTPYPHTKLTIRGADAAEFDDRLELYTGSVTIVIFAEGAVARRAADGLIPLNATATREAAVGTDDLPRSEPGPDCA
jgi:hypothetical protein